MEGRIERALVDLQDVLGDLLDALGDGPAVQGILLQRAQDQQIERAGQQVGGSRHGVDSRQYKVLVSAVNTSGRDQKLQQMTLSTSLTMIELPVMAGCAHSADCAIGYRRPSAYFGGFAPATTRLPSVVEASSHEGLPSIDAF